MAIPLPGLLNIPALVGQLRAAADLLERIAGIFAPAAAPASVALLAAPAVVETAAAVARRHAKPRKPHAKKPAKRAARKTAAAGSGEWRVWTEERKAIMRRDWPAGVETSVIRAALNRLPGPQIGNVGRVASAAGTLGLHRPGRARPRRTPPSEDAPPAASPVREAAPAASPVREAPPAASPVREAAPAAVLVQEAVPAAAPRVPQQRAPAALLSRDGLPSVGQRQDLEATAQNDVAAVSWADAMTWASRNKVTLGGTEEDDLLATNLARHALHLPPFMIVARRGRPEKLPHPRLGGSDMPAGT